MVNDLTTGDPEAATAKTALIMVYVGLGVFALSAVFVSCWMVAASRQVARIRLLFFHAVLRQEIGWHDEHKPGELTARMTGDTRVLQNGINDKLANGIMNSVMGIGGFIFGFISCWELTLVMMGTMPFLAIMAAIIGSFMAKMTEASRKFFAVAGAISTEVMENIRTVQSFGREEYEVGRFHKAVLTAQAAGIKKELSAAVATGVTMAMIFITYCVAFFFASYLIEWGRTDVGKIVAAFMSVLMGSFGIGFIAPSATAFTESRAAAYQLFEIIDRTPSIDIDAPGEPMTGFKESIEFNHVSFAYPTRPDMLLFKDLCLTIKKGQKVAFSGASGCGKSSIIGLLQRFYDPLSGDVLVDGQDMRKLSLKQLRSHIGIVSQEPNLFMGSGGRMSHIDFKRVVTVGVEDLVLLHTLNDKSICENLKLRHSKDLIYTNIGPVLLSVNPFKRLPIYSDDRIAYYRANSKSTTAPHVFALAEDTYHTMVSEEENQCVIISGESGAGKTEASKQIMQYIAAVSGNSGDMQRVKHIMLESNPLLEAFGNAKTVRNDNSSRFGKFFEIYFNRQGGPIGGHMSNFLLEKSRVVSQQKGERNFHVFYQLCRGGDAALREKLRLKNPGEFFYLSQGGTLDRAGVDDAMEWKETLEAMEAMGIAATDQESIFSALAFILHLGEIRFAQGKGDECIVSNRDVLVFAAKLMGLDASLLERALTWKRLEMGTSEVVNVPLDAQQCTNARDAIAKVVYDKLFDFIVETVNTAFGKREYALMLGVLDIYGFEIFDRNGFEQFCINYVNEKLQQIFIELTLKVEQEEYVREKIAWEEIKYFNNKIVCDLIEGSNPPGLFAVIDDVCATMSKEKESVADIKMLDKLDAAHGGNPHFTRTEKGFIIRHYAGDVHYDAAGFTNRNKDLLSVDIVAMLGQSTNGFLLEILSDLVLDGGSSDPRGQTGRKKHSTTAGFKIRQQAADLVKTLMKCNPHYVRTIKSNDEKRGDFFDEPRVLHQVKYLGLLENVRVRRAGYSYRQYFDKFLKRFKLTCPATFPRPFRGPDKDACAAILNNAGHVLPHGTWQLGQTKVFIRQPQHLFAMEDLREAAFDKIAYKIQRAWNRFRNNKDFIVLKANIDKLYARGGKERRADSVFRPFVGDHLEYKTKLEPLHPFVNYDPVASAWKEFWSDTGKKYYSNFITTATQWERPYDLNPQKIVFSDKVERVIDHTKAHVNVEFMIVTDRAIYFIQESHETIVTPPTKPTRKNPHPPPPPAPYTVQRIVLRKRLDLRLLAGVSVSARADSILVLHVYPVPGPYRQVQNTPIKGTPFCECCGCKLTPAAKKQNCPCCGRLCCIKMCLVNARPLPTLGYPKPMKVCPFCVTGEPLEPQEDVVLLSAAKTEVAALVRRIYKQMLGNKIPLAVSDVITYQLSGEAVPRQLHVASSPAISETALLATGSGVINVSAPVGISQEKIKTIEVAREERRRQAAERRRREEEEARVKEAEREREREETHRKMVEERKRMKAEAEEVAERERLAREQAARERREAAARAVAQRSTR